MNGLVVRAGLAAVVALAAPAPPAAAQSYPSRQVDLIVPFVAGGTTDTVARLIAQRDRISKEGADPVGSSPEQFDKRIRGEIEKWARVLKASGPTPK